MALHCMCLMKIVLLLVEVFDINDCLVIYVRSDSGSQPHNRSQLPDMTLDLHAVDWLKPAKLMLQKIGPTTVMGRAKLLTHAYKLGPGAGQI